MSRGGFFRLPTPQFDVYFGEFNSTHENNMPRTDKHSPSQIQPQDYTFVGVNYLGEVELGSVEFFNFQRKQINEHMQVSGGKYSNHQHGGTCHCCGAFALYVAVYHHPADNVYIRVGETCADKVELAADSGDRSIFRTMRTKVKDVRDRIAGKAKAHLTLTESDIDADEVVRLVNLTYDELKSEKLVVNRDIINPVLILRDIYSRLVKYGRISDKQLAFVVKLLDQIDGYADKMEARKAAELKEQESWSPVPDDGERHTITGEIVSVREPDEYSVFPSWKMLVKTTEGFKLWGSMPRAISPDDKGAEVTFTARLTRSDKDQYFGFYSRPTKVKVKETV